jgi:type II secretory pathway component PulF
MPLYRYRAVDHDGKAVEGTMEAESARLATAALKERGLQVNAVEDAEGQQRGFPRMKQHLTWQDLDLCNHQLLAIVKSGLPLAPSLRALAEEINSRRLKRVLDDVRVQIEAGSSLEEAISRHPESFSPVYRAMIRAGERTGNLSGVLNQLTAYSSRMVEMKNSVQEAVAYPILILVACVAILGFIMVKVVPVFAAIYGDFGGRLPGPTQLVVDISDFVVRHKIALPACVIGGVVLLWLIVRLLHRAESGRYALDWLKLRVPIFGALYSSASLARFSRSLGLLLGSRVPIGESLDLASAASGNAVLRAAVTDALNRIQAGERMSEAFASTGFFAHTFCWMLSTAEDRGDVEGALLELADAYETGVTRMDKLVLMLVGPILVVAVAIVIGFLIISLYLPIFMLGDAIQGL